MRSIVAMGVGRRQGAVDGKQWAVDGWRDADGWGQPSILSQLRKSS